MLDTILDRLDPIIAEAIIILIGARFGWIFTVLFRTKAAQDNLHRAIESGIDWATDEIAQLLNSGGEEEAKRIAVDKVVSHVEASVPDSLKILKANPKAVRNIVEGKVLSMFLKMGGKLVNLATS